MKLLFFDTETTDINDKIGQICQLSYIIVNTNTKKTYGKNFFFSVKGMSEGAYKTHGLTIEKLKELSNGKCFLNVAKEIHEDFVNVDYLIGHNVTFDIKFINREFSRANLTPLTNKYFCSMRYYTDICKLPKARGIGYKWPKLDDVIKFLKIDSSQIEDLCNKLFEGASAYHDSRFDIAGTYLIVYIGIKKGYIPKGYFTKKEA